MKKLTSIVVMCMLAVIVTAQNYSKIAIIGTHYDYDPGVLTLGDDDEKAATAWLISQGGEYIGAERIIKPTDEGGVDLSNYDALWIHLDRVTNADIANFREFQYGYLGNADVVNAITQFYKNGGNILLTNHASLYLKDLGRIGFDPNEWNARDGSDNQDTWFASPTHGTYNTDVVPHDRGNDPIYTGLSHEGHVRLNGIEYKKFPFIGGGYKEDHNCFWSMSIPDNEIGNEEELKLTTFENTFNVDVLATWTHVEDYFGAAIARWKPTEEYKGTAVTIGIAAYEWNQNSGENPYQYNIIRLTRNVLKELAPMTTPEHLSLSGEWSDGEFASLDHSLLTSLDLTGITAGLNNKPSTINPNCLIFVTSESGITGDNVIVDGRAQNIVLADNNAFSNPYEFKTHSISYQRTINNTGWASLYLPFETSNLQGERIEQFVSCDGNIASFETVESIAANTPYIIKVSTTGQKTFSASDNDGNLTIEQTTHKNIVRGDYTFKGTFHTIPAGKAEGLLMLTTDGSGYAPGSDKASIPAFRSYIEYTGSESGARPLSIIHEDNGATNVDTNDTNASLRIWTANGALKIYTTAKQTIDILSIDGRAIANISLAEGENSIEGLARGVYIINGIKIIL